MQVRLSLLAVLASFVFLSACTRNGPDISGPGRVASTKEPDKFGVVCYTTVYRGEFSCVKVENK